jgi:hypothetical protein
MLKNRTGAKVINTFKRSFSASIVIPPEQSIYIPKYTTKIALFLYKTQNFSQ